MIIYSLISKASSLEETLYRDSIELKMCIGDGYIFVFKDPLNAVLFSAQLANRVQCDLADKKLAVDFHFRIGINTGKVYSFWDYSRNAWNYAGVGINGGQRVIGVIGRDLDDVVFLSEQVVIEIRSVASSHNKARPILNCLENKGTRKDKHGVAWRVYQLNHERLVSDLQRISTEQDAQEFPQGQGLD